MTRRTFIGTAAAAATAAAAPARLPIRKAVWYGMLPKELSVADKFKMARDAGFEEIEVPTTPEQSIAEEIKKAAEASKVGIHSVMCMSHWKYPFSSADPAVIAENIKGMETSLRNAHLWGATAVLLVPGVVNPEIRYQDAWTRSQVHIRKLIPLAEKLKVVIGIENVWNKFLLSPLEMARYVDEFKSPWVRAYLDVGNMVLYGFPQDWIRTLGKRIVKLHFKDFRFRKMQAEFVNLRDGDIDWKEVHKALAEVGYKGSATVELAGGGLEYLKDVAHRVDLILEGA